MCCKTLSFSAFSITCLLLIWMTVTVRPALSARKLASQPEIPGGSGKGSVTGDSSPKGPSASGSDGGGQGPGIPSPVQSSPFGAGGQSSSSSNSGKKCTSERRCVSSSTGGESCTTVNNCESTSSQQNCVNGTCYNTP